MSAIKQLLAYQEEDAKLFEIEKKLNESDARKKGVQAQRFLKTVAETLAGIEAKAQELNAAYDASSAELEKLSEENAGFKAIAEKVANEKELSYLKESAAKLSKNLNELLRKIQKIEQEMNELALQYSKLKKETVAYQEQYEKSSTEFASLKEGFASERKQIEDNLKKLSATIPADIMNKYVEKRKDKQFPIVYTVSAKDRHCTACGTELSLKQLENLKKDDVVHECENCRKIILLG
jgi:predicted  nucleic acid-binding Zn-ribbon protein